jgi:transposase
MRYELTDSWARLRSGALLLADRGYDADWIRTLVRRRGAWTNIPPRSNRREALCFSPHLYRARNLVERFFNKNKQCRRVATRYDKRPLGIARAHPAPGELGDVAGHQREPGAGAGRQIGGTAGSALAAGDAFEPGQEVLEEVGRLLHAPAVQAQAGMHIDAGPHSTARPHRPLNSGARFSTTARVASRASSVCISLVLYSCSSA